MKLIENDEELKEKLDNIYKEILSNRIYNIGCSNPREINIEDIDVFYQALDRLYELKEEYRESYNNRKMLGNKIASLAGYLNILTDRIHSVIRNDRESYKASDKLIIRDFEKIINVLYNAQNSQDFALKKIHAEGIGSFGKEHGTKEIKLINGVVYIIGDALMLSEIEEEKRYSEEDIYKFISKLTESGKSLIVAANYYFVNNILPLDSYLEIKGNSSIYCYLKNDIMKEIVDRFLVYAEENGNHIDDIPEADILNNISVGFNRTRKLLDRSKIPMIARSIYVEFEEEK